MKYKIHKKFLNFDFFKKIQNSVLDQDFPWRRRDHMACKINDKICAKPSKKSQVLDRCIFDKSILKREKITCSNKNICTVNNITCKLRPCKSDNIKRKNNIYYANTNIPYKIEICNKSHLKIDKLNNTNFAKKTLKDNTAKIQM